MGSFSGGSTGVTINSSQPISPNSGEIWVNNSTNKLYIRNSSNTDWLELSQTQVNTFTTAATFTPNKQTEKSLVVVDAENQTQGYMTVIVDGSEVAQVEAGSKDYFVVNPSTSLSIKSNNTTLDETGQTLVASYTKPSQYNNGEFGSFTSEDGTYYYLCYSNKIACFTLSTPYAIEGGKTLLGEVTPDNISNIYFEFFNWNNDGTKIYGSLGGYFTSTSGTSTIYEYTPASAYNLYGMTTTPSASKTLTSIPNNSGVHILSSDGTKLYTYCSGNSTFYRHNLSTAWDITTASYHSSKSGLTASSASYNMNIFIDSQGKYLLVTTKPSSQLLANRYTFGTPYDLSTLTYTSQTSLGTNWTGGEREMKIITGNQTHIIDSARPSNRYTWAKTFTGTSQSQVS